MNIYDICCYSNHIYVFMILHMYFCTQIYVHKEFKSGGSLGRNFRGLHEKRTVQRIVQRLCK